MCYDGPINDKGEDEVTQKISVTRALAQIKSLNDRIEKGISVPFITNLTGGKHGTGKTVTEIETTLKASLQSVKDLIEQRKALKSAVVRSNAITTVKINGVELTVAEAIERKSSIALEQRLLHQLKGQLAQVTANVEKTNVEMSRRLDALLLTAVGKDRQASETELAAISAPFKAQNEGKALDPNDLSVVIESLQKDIDGFLLEVDYALSEINATTMVDA